MKHQPLPCIIIDTREQKPYQFETASMLRKLDIGDYSLHGFEDQFAIERKELNDFISCMIDKTGCENRSRFERELDRAKEKLRRLWILVEADFKDVRHGTFRSEIKVNSVIATILAWQNRYPIQVIWGGDRASSAKLARLILERSYRDWTEGKVSS